MAVEFERKDKYSIDDLISIITILRAPDGCPWDREQTHFSIKKNFIEETYEVIEAINKESVDGLREELGDVLLQIMLHCEMEREQGNFDFSDICDELCRKLIIRHPHVFSNVEANNVQEVLSVWDSVKQKTKGQDKCSRILSDIPLELPALMRAQKVQCKASKAGFDWQNISGALNKIQEEINELNNAVSHKSQQEIEDEFGDVLFSCVNVARFLSVDSEEALKASTDKFIRRFTLVEQLAEEKGISVNDAPLEILDALWDEAKEILAE